MVIDKKILEEILPAVEKPARYLGNEVNSIHKREEEVDVRFLFAFPDIYDVGMSHMGLHILYGLINDLNKVSCERVFTPWTDMEKELRDRNLPLFSLESKRAINQFDIIGFTLQYEMSYTNILNMLDMGKIKVRASERTEEDPLIIAGGPCSYNPEPIHEIVDVFMMGEAEASVVEFIEEYKKAKAEGMSKQEFLISAAKIEGIYVPSLYEELYNEDGTVAGRKAKVDKIPMTVKKRIIEDLDSCYFPEKIMVPFVEPVHDRIMLELFRGCTRGCRFCQAGMIYRPIRERSVERLLDIADKLVNSTGYEEISLSSLSTSDYSNIQELVIKLIEKYKDKKIGLSLPSLRLDDFPFEVIEEIQKVRKTGLTFAPEAGSQRLRDVINKGVEESDLIESTKKAFERGWSTVKLYFMIGLPTETEEDVMGIKDLAYRVKDEFFAQPKESRKGNLKVTASASCFVPKPFTPFQWHPQNTLEEFKEKQVMLKRAIRDKKVTFNTHDATVSFMEAVFARGDRKVCEALIKAWEKGCKFDGWSDHFDYEKWMEAFEEVGVDPYFYATRERSYDEVFPWDFIDVGVTKEFLRRENEKAKSGELTHDCRKGCTGCGINTGFIGGVC